MSDIDLIRGISSKPSWWIVLLPSLKRKPRHVIFVVVYGTAEFDPWN